MRLLRILVLLVIVGFFSSPVWSAFYGPYAVNAPMAIDGDTIRGDIAIWPDMTADVSIRVRGVDTPELHGATQCERDLAAKAKAFTDAWLLANGPILIGGVAPDKYAGRYDAVVTGIGGKVLAEALIQSGNGRAYSGGKRDPWCQ